MKRKWTIILMFVIAMVILSVIQMSTSKKIFKSINRANLEALAYGELPGAWCQNFKSSTVWYRESWSASMGVTLTEPSLWLQITQNWVSMVCCVQGTDMDACDMDEENSECSARVIRPAC
ncbi:MAG: hypothetical protein ACOX59_04810 [Bacteroidales bacterium]|jgi:hypothetical protein|nr:hypothetical protein [Bacteroidales bacterium]MDI9544969.1 hypothetical protein [Bacteroidota bacterium]MBP8981771.1 hypothetical protein [Bacteroidales bacterium]HPB34961.1 hypothetical protein [Bacteroidales bacterium]HPY57602.1 hypothetical protein [Bacteroidales bacterium]